ncbi:MAG: sigma 54-interacting transcriptional regulator [Deltaproteobacteria bacterium]|nr:sigma 54-interacting transcriptional regulator [Deltaproteobacteria bacterium]
MVRNGLLEAKSLDVVWAPNTETALDLPIASFEAVVLALEEFDLQRNAVTKLSERAGTPPLLALSPAGSADLLRASLPVGRGEILVSDTPGPGAGWQGILRDRIERVIRERNRSSAAGPGFARQGDSAGEIIGHSEAIRTAFELAERAANGITTILLQGETGTGKEIFAKAIHRMSPRVRQRFVAINCAAIPDALLESELFGHVRGAFTGANSSKPGLFELAQGGTLFLDEIGETSIALQAKLLRALQEREIRPVGGSHDKRVDVRIITASNRDLRVEAARGVFREDLYYRLAVFPISIPPLRKRDGDIILIAQHFLEKYGRSSGGSSISGSSISGSSISGSRAQRTQAELSQAAAELLLTYPWPGNVRELENEIQRAVTLAGPGTLITPEYLSEPIRNIAAPIASEDHIGKTLREIVAQVEAQVIRRTLANNAGRRARSARDLGITREGLYKKMKRLGVE